MADRIESPALRADAPSAVAEGLPSAVTEGLAAGRTATTRVVDLIGLLLVVAVVAVSLRLLDIDRNPPELFEDELSGAVSAWSLATTGQDVVRTSLPFLVTRLELKQPLYFVATVPFQATLGQTTLAVRLPAVAFGLVSTLLVAGVLVVLGFGATTAVLGSALFAITPWAIHYARAGWEPAALLPFTLGGLALLWIGLRDHRRGPTVAAAVVLAVGAYTYHPALLMHVALAATVTAFHLTRLRRADLVALVAGAVVAAVLLVPYLLAFGDPLFFERTRNISAFRNGLTLEALGTVWTHYLVQWDPAWLFAGVAPNPRINPGVLLLPWTLPFLGVGLYHLARRRTRADLFLLAWLVLGPLPAAITDDGTVPHAARGLVALPAIVAATAIGLGRVFELAGRVSRPRLAQGAIGVGLVVLAVVGVATFSADYFGEYPRRSANWWGFGGGAALQAAADHVPVDGTLCIATNDLSRFTLPHQVAWHIPDHRFRIFEGLAHDVCREPGTYVLGFVRRSLDVQFRTVATIPDAYGAPFYRLVVVEG